MPRRIVLALLIAMAVSSCAFAAQQAATEDLLRRITPPTEPTEEIKKECYWETFYEPSNVIQGTRRGHWTELTNRFGCVSGGINGYIEQAQYERFDGKDFTLVGGYYFNFRDYYVHTEVGFGWDSDYMWEFQNVIEYGHRLIKDLFWQVGYTYRSYAVHDSHLLYPGLIYYFGNNYMSIDYGASFIESRDTGHWGVVKGYFEILDWFGFFGGYAFGQRLYDIYELDAHQQRSCILFCGAQVTVYKSIKVRLGYSYGQEEPKFVKHSLNFVLSARF